VQLGLALPQYDFSLPGRSADSPLDWSDVADWAAQAEAAGFDSVWLSDHVVWSIEKYGAAPGEYEGYDPIVGLAALARTTANVTLGTLVLAPIRPPTVAAKALSGVDRLSRGRLVVGLGAGWFEPDFALTGQDMPPPAERLDRLREAVEVTRGCFATAPTEPFDYDGRHYHAHGLRNAPGPARPGGPPIWVGGRGPRLAELAADVADGWNTGWGWTPEDYEPRMKAVRNRLEEQGRDPDQFTFSVNLYALVGEDDRDLRARFERLQAQSPKGVLDGMTLHDYRQGRLVGTVEQAAEQLAQWAELQVAHVVVCLGAVPFSSADPDDLDPVVAAGA
jgi:alkanesulfonate monooxygenase